MRSRTEPHGSAAPTHHRCRCGHFPTAHMQVVAVTESGGFRLDPLGPCTTCGEAGCRQFAPSP